MLAHMLCAVLLETGMPVPISRTVPRLACACAHKTITWASKATSARRRASSARSRATSAAAASASAARRLYAQRHASIRHLHTEQALT